MIGQVKMAESMTAQRMNEKTAWITGAASGMGRATAELFAAEGANVSVVDVNTDLGPKVTDRIKERGGRAIFLPCDVSKEDQVHQTIDATVECFGALHMIVNNAGIAHAGLLHDYTEQQWDQLMGVNVKAIFFSVKHGISHLRKNEHSYMVNVGSISSFVAQFDTPAYTTSKGAVLLLSRSIAVDYAADGLRCNCVCPGITDTPMLHGYYDSLADGEAQLARRLTRVPIGRMIQPEEIAKAIRFFCCEDSSGVTGTYLIVDGGYLTAAEWDTSRT